MEPRMSGKPVEPGRPGDHGNHSGSTAPDGGDERVFPGTPSKVPADGGRPHRGFSRRAQLAAARCLAALSCLLVLVAVGLAVSGGGMPPVADLLRTTADQPGASDGRTTVGGSSVASGSVEGESGEAGRRVGSGTADAPAGSVDGGGAGGSDGSASSGAATGPAGASAASGEDAVGAPGASGGAAAEREGGQGDVRGDAPAASAPSEGTAKPEAASTITVHVTVDASADGGGVLASASISLAAGATAYDALTATGLSVNARSTGFGIYVAAIGGYAEFDQGGESGWKYQVNGTYPGTSAGGYALADGDSVTWEYVTHA